jgi:hypothetical protein
MLFSQYVILLHQIYSKKDSRNLSICSFIDQFVKPLVDPIKYNKGLSRGHFIGYILDKLFLVDVHDQLQINTLFDIEYCESIE